MEIVVPPLPEQDRFVSLIQAALREKKIMQAIAEKRRAFMDGILKNLTK
jgi:restriction endonuclease S subunit